MGVYPYRLAYHCVGWHAVVCYGAPEWYRSANQASGRPPQASRTLANTDDGGKGMILESANETK